MSIERIAKLLNQAENAGTEAESTAFMEAAQRLATIHAIDLAKARALTKGKEKSRLVQKRVVLGKPRQRGLNTYVELIGGIANANDVRYTIARNSTYVNLFGYEEDVNTVETLFASLLTQMISACEEYKRSGDWKQETHWVPGRYVMRNRDGSIAKSKLQWDGWSEEWNDGQRKPTTWVTARLDFQNAYARQIGIRLSKARQEAEREQREAERYRKARPHVDHESGELTTEFMVWFLEETGHDLSQSDWYTRDLVHKLIGLNDEWANNKVLRYQAYLEEHAQTKQEGPSTELVLANKTREVESFFAEKNGARGYWRGYHFNKTDGATSAGRSAANQAQLGRSKELPGARKAIA